MTRNKKIGIILLLSPWIILVVILVLYAITGVISNSLTPQPSADVAVTDSGLQPRSPTIVWLQLARVVLSLVGTLNFFYLFIGTGLGIYFLVKKENLPSPSLLK